MNLNDIIALAKQGYKPSDIKELIALSEQSEVIVVEPEAPAEVQPTEVEAAKEPDKPLDKVAEPAVDYKKLYEDSQKLISDLQKQNRDRNVKPEEQQASAYDILSQII